MTVQISNLSRHYGRDAALAGIDLDIADGEFLALLGPSGAGKTTLLRLIAGLDQPDAGAILIDGVDVRTLTPRQRRIGFVFQNYALFRHMTVARNIAFGLSVRPRRDRPSRARIAARVAELLDLMQLSGLGGRFPAQLSGGQRQRVALARALAVDPQVLLLDEPFGALDAQVRGELREWLHGLQRQLGLTTVFVTHDQHEAFQLADRIALLNRGCLEQVGTPTAIRGRAANPFVSGFVGAGGAILRSVSVAMASACRCAESGEAAALPAGSPVGQAQPFKVADEEDATVTFSSSAPAEAIVSDRPIWPPRVMLVAPAADAVGADLPAVAAGELWLLAAGAGAVTPLEHKALAGANVIIYDRALTDWVVSLLPLGGYAEPATDNAVARCIQFMRDGWSVLRLIDHGADRDLAVGHAETFAESLRLAGAPTELRVRRFLADEKGNPAAEGRLEDVAVLLRPLIGPQAWAVVFDAFAIGESTRQTIMANGLAG